MWILNMDKSPETKERKFIRGGNDTELNVMESGCRVVWATEFACASYTQHNILWTIFAFAADIYSAKQCVIELLELNTAMWTRERMERRRRNIFIKSSELRYIKWKCDSGHSRMSNFSILCSASSSATYLLHNDGRSWYLLRRRRTSIRFVHWIRCHIDRLCVMLTGRRWTMMCCRSNAIAIDVGMSLLYWLLAGGKFVEEIHTQIGHWRWCNEPMASRPLLWRCRCRWCWAIVVVLHRWISCIRWFTKGIWRFWRDLIKHWGDLFKFGNRILYRCGGGSGGGGTGGCDNIGRCVGCCSWCRCWCCCWIIINFNVLFGRQWTKGIRIGYVVLFRFGHACRWTGTWWWGLVIFT